MPTAAPERFLGVDVGGTQVKAGVVAAAELEDARAQDLVGRTRAIDTRLEDGVELFFDRLADFARTLAPGARIGMGFPGMFDPRTGRLVCSPNLKETGGLDIAAELARRLGCGRDSITIANDANVAVYAEQWLGAGRGERDLVMLTLGTGIGGGIVLGGELFTGPHGIGAEVGHLILRALRPGEPEEDGLRCGCGAYGCFERLASASAALRRARAAGLEGELDELADRARAGGERERALFHAVGRDLGAGLLSIASLIDVTTFAVGGGFSAALDLLLPGCLEAYGERVSLGPELRVVPAELGGSAGWIGAARLAAERAGRRVA